MIDHEHDGAFGLVVNQPTDISVQQIIESLDLTWTGDGQDVAWLGGPVNQATCWVLHEPRDDVRDEEGTREIADGIYLSASVSAVTTIVENPRGRLKFVLGYSGWGPTQLESEMAAGSWVNSDVTPELLFDIPPEQLWEASICRIGVSPTSLSPASGVH